MIHFNLQSLLTNNESLKQANAVKLKADQILSGKVLKWFADDVALVQTGSLKFHAKVNAQVSANVNYWFQVTINEGMVELKVIDDALQAKEGSGIGNAETVKINVLNQLGLSNTKENNQIIRFLMDNQLPVTKEIIHTAKKLLSHVHDRAKGLEALKIMLGRELPLTKTVFNSLLALQSEQLISDQLKEIGTLIRDQKTKSPAIVQLQNIMEKLVSQTSQEKELAINQILLKELFLSSRLSEQQLAHSILEKKGGQFENLKQIQLATINAIRDLIKTVPELAKLSLNKDMDARLFFNQVLTFLDTLSIEEQQKNLVYKVIQEQFNLNKLGVHSFTAAESELIMKAEQSLSGTQLNMNASLDIGQTVKNLLYNLGLQYERDIGTGKTTEATLQQVKPLLMSILKEEIPYSLKEKAEHLLHRITGMQLIAIEQNGPMQQILLQFPLMLGNHLTDLNMQWTGRKKKDGQIDPNYCRILFYLELENLKDTIIDVNVQNRIVNIQVYNGTPLLDVLVKKYDRLLKERLQEYNYVLSSVKVFKENDFPKSSKIQSTFSAMQTIHSTMTGVDFRV